MEPVFLISALRAVVEMLGLCLLGQGALYLLGGQAVQRNPVYQFFNLVTRAPRQLCTWLLPFVQSPLKNAWLTFVFLFVIWLALAVVRKFL